MKDKSINIFFEKVKAIYGESKLQPYGTSPNEKHGTGFKIEGIPAIFSVLTLEGTLSNCRYDVQVESDPPGDYVYADEMELNEFISLIERLCGPESEWL